MTSVWIRNKCSRSVVRNVGKALKTCPNDLMDSLMSLARSLMPPAIYNILRRFKWWLRGGSVEDFETSLTRFLEREKEVLTVPSLLPPDAVCIDVGANVGCFSCFIMRSRADAKVFAFEPRPDIFRQLNDNLSAFEQCITINAAASFETGELTISIDPSHGRSTVVESSATAGLRRAKIRAVRLDSFVEESHLPRLDFLKIDVEGYEWEVLKGASGSIRKFTPIILCEVEDRHLIYRNIAKEDLFSWMQEELGYRVFLLDHGRFLPYGQRNQLEEREMDISRIFNWFLVHSSKVHLLNQGAVLDN